MPGGGTLGMDIGMGTGTAGIKDQAMKDIVLRDPYHHITAHKIEMLGHLLDEAVYFLERTLEQTTDLDLRKNGQTFLKNLPAMRESVLKGIT